MVIGSPVAAIVAVVMGVLHAHVLLFSTVAVAIAEVYPSRLVKTPIATGPVPVLRLPNAILVTAILVPTTGVKVQVK